LRSVTGRERRARDQDDNGGRRVLIVDDALDLAGCQRIRLAMDLGAPEAAAVLDDTIDVDVAVRSTTHIEIDTVTQQFLDRFFNARRGQLEQFYGLTLGAREGVSVLRYSAGGFFKPHRDRGLVPSWPAAARRCIAMVLFLTTSRTLDPSGTFSGGILRLLSDDGGVERDLPPRAGTFVAFPATTLHEVTPVTAGVRDTVVDWFYDGDSNVVTA